MLLHELFIDALKRCRRSRRCIAIFFSVNTTRGDLVLKIRHDGLHVVYKPRARKEMRETTRFVVPSAKLWFQAVFLLFLKTLLSKASTLPLGLLLPYNGSSNSTEQGGISHAAAILLAVQKINNDSSLLPGNQVTFVWNDTLCASEEVSIRAIFNQLERGVKAYIGPGCNCETQAKIAAAWNVPMISYVSTGEETCSNAV